MLLFVVAWCLVEGVKVGSVVGVVQKRANRERKKCGCGTRTGCGRSTKTKNTEQGVLLRGTRTTN